jgi:PAS domain S-box-containing protein
MQLPFLRRPLVASLLALAIGLGVTALAWHETRSAAHAAALQRFLGDAGEVAHRFTRRFSDYESLLRTGATLVSVQDDLTRAQWAKFAERVDSGHRYPGMRALGLAGHVLPHAVPAFEQRIRGQGLPRYRVWSTAERGAFLVPVVSSEPYADNAGALGFDMASEPVRRSALETARDSGRPALSGRVVLIYDSPGADRAGFLLFAPFYRAGAPVGSVERRRRAIEGFVFGAFRMREAIEPLLGDVPPTLDLAVYGSAYPESSHLLFDSRPDSAAANRRRPRFAADLPVEIGQNVWTLRFNSRPEFEAASASALPGVVLGTGSALSLLLAGLILAIGRTRDNAEALAARMTAQEHAARQEAERAQRFLDAILTAIPQPVYVKDEAHRFVMANAATARMLCAPPGGLIGLRDEDLLTRQAALAAYAEDDEVRSRGQPVEREVQIEPLHGEPWWGLKFKTAVRMPQGRSYVVGVTIDVTERRQALQELERARRFLNEVMDAMPNALCVKDAQHRWIMCNAAFARLHGRGAEELRGRTDLDLHDAHTAVKHQAEDERVLASGAPLLAEQVHMRPDGSVAWLLKSKHRIDLPDGSAGVIAVLTDITERKRGEAELESSRHLLEAVLNASPSPMWVKDGEGRWLLINDSGVRLLGGQRVQFLGKRVQDLYGPDVAAAVQEQDRAALSSDEVLSVEGEMHALDGDVRWGIKRKRALSLPDGRRILVISVMDLTEQRAVQLEVEGARALLNAVFDAVPVILSVKDDGGRVVLINSACMEFHQRPPEYFIGRTDEDFLGAEQAAVTRVEDQAARASAETLAYEVPFSSASGEQRWVIKRKRAFTLPGGGRGVVTALYDVTQLKNAQEELTRHRDNLQQLVDERTRELRNALDAAQAASRAKSEFLANMSHELRTPMHAILSFARLGWQRAAPEPGDLAAKLAHYFSRIDESAERLLRLLNDLLDLSKLEAGRMHYELADHDPVALVNAVVQETAPLASAGQIRVRVASTLQDAALRCDAVRMAQVVRNLLSNAIKFTSPGGEVLVRLEPLEPAAGAAARAGVCLSVEDTGVGIPAAELESIFQKFVQSTRTRSKAGGTGLGLAICREIVQAHGGSIRAENRAEGGSRFVVVLPGLIEAGPAQLAASLQRRSA